MDSNKLLDIPDSFLHTEFHMDPDKLSDITDFILVIPRLVKMYITRLHLNYQD